MQALHEESERRAAAVKKLTEALQVKEAELTIMNGHVNAAQKRIQELQQRYAQAERADAFKSEYLGTFEPPRDPEGNHELARIEEQIMGIPSKRKQNTEAFKYAADGEASLRGMSGDIQEKARLFKMHTGRTASWKEIQRWTGSK